MNMASITREFEIELSDGRTINVSVTVEGEYESDYGADADGNRGVGTWFVSGHSFEADEALTPSEEYEVSEKVDELVSDESWDFDSAEDEYSEDDGDLF
jgi:hypothetical protein